MECFKERGKRGVAEEEGEGRVQVRKKKRANVLSVRKVEVESGKRVMATSSPDPDPDPEEGEVVPWRDSEEWKEACGAVRSGNYEDALYILRSWQARGVALPLGVETTLYLLEALKADRPTEADPLNNGVRSMYITAVIRFMNFIGHLAASAAGETTAQQLRELATGLDVPDWLVSLRNDVNHGLSLPAVGHFRNAGFEMLNWLKEKYWIFENEEDEEEDELDELGLYKKWKNEMNYVEELSDAFVACRIWKLSGKEVIKDEVILQFVTRAKVASTDEVLKGLKRKLSNMMGKMPIDYFNLRLARDMVPSDERCDNFKQFLAKSSTDDIFEIVFSIWQPIFKVFQNAGYLQDLMVEFGSMFAKPCDENQYHQELCAKWIKKSLETLKSGNTPYYRHYAALLEKTIKAPSTAIMIFCPQLLDMMRPTMSDMANEASRLIGIMYRENERGNWVYQENQNDLRTLDDAARNGIPPEATNRNEDSAVGTDEDPGNQASQNSIRRDTRDVRFWTRMPFGAVVRRTGTIAPRD